jgi:hypothetical protein
MKTKPILPPTWEIPQIFRDRMGEDYGRQRIMHHDGHLLIILHRPSGPEKNTRDGRLFWRKPDGLWTSTEKGGIHALQQHLDEFEDSIIECEEAEEKATVPSEYFELIERLSPLKRTTTNMYQVLQDGRKAVPEDRTLILIRDRAYQLSRTSNLGYDAAKNGLDFSMAKSAEKNAESTLRMSIAAHRLNLLASFFFPLATVASVMGMGILTIPEELSLMIFVLIILAGLSIGGILTIFISSKSKQH